MVGVWCQMSAQVLHARTRGTEAVRLTHIARGPDYKVALCGKPRGAEPLKPLKDPDCVVCIEMHRQAGGGRW